MKPRLKPSNFGNAPITLLPALSVSEDFSNWADAVSWAISADRLNKNGTNAKIVGSQQIVRAMEFRNEGSYGVFHVVKPEGKSSRAISVPSDQIKNLQSGLLPLIPSHLAHPSSYAYESGKSAILCARQHIGMTSGIKIDLVGFFDQIREANVQDLFECLGATEFSAKNYAKLLTRPMGEMRIGKTLQSNGILPQGAPTSGAISNLMCAQMDDELNQLATKHNLTYTRYSDDMLFSSRSSEFSKLKTLRILKEIRICINRFGLNINSKKTRVFTPHNTHQYLGLLIGQADVRLPKHFVRKVSSSSRALKKFGLRAVEEEYANGNAALTQHKSKTRHHSPTFLRRYVGQLSYISQIDPSWAGHLARETFGVILSDPKTWFQLYDDYSKDAITANLKSLTKL